MIITEPDVGHLQAQEGVVIAVGSGRLTADGKVLPLNVKEGDKVLLPEYGGTKVDMGAKDVECAPTPVSI